MKKFKSERDWSDLERADKIVMAIFMAAFLGIGYGLIKDNNLHNIQQHVVKTQFMRPGR